MPLTVTPFPGGVGSTVVAGATSAAPAANTQICTTGALGGGGGPNNQPDYYWVSVLSYQIGTPDSNAANIFVRVGSNVFGTLLSTPQNSSGNPQSFRVPVASGQSIDIVTGNTAGGGGAIYVASMTATRIKGGYEK